MVSFAGRVESSYTVPASTTVSVSSGALTSAVPVTWTAGTYYHTAAGTVTSGPTVLAAAINAAVSPYPDNASSMATAVGYGTWSAGWSFQIASGNDTGMFGGVTMTAAGTPTYRTSTGLAGTDYAIGFDSAGDGFAAGDVFDVTDAQDLVFAWVGRWSATPGNYQMIVSKTNGGDSYSIFGYSDGSIYISVTSTPTGYVQTECASGALQSWHVGIGVIERATGTMRVGVRSLDGLSSAVSSNRAISAETLANAGSFDLGIDNFGGGLQLAAAYVGTGAGYATGLSTNLSTALTNFANAVSSSFSVSLSTSTGLCTLSNSFWPCAITFTSTNTRDLLGFASNFDYPQTAAQLTTALGGYGTFTSGAAYLMNESSGSLATAFGSPSLTVSVAPTYSVLGPRGGTDTGLTFDSTDKMVGGDNFNVTSTGDLALLLVWRVGASPSATTYRNITSKGSASSWNLYTYTDGSSVTTLELSLYDGATTAVSTHTLTAGPHWYVTIGVLDRSTGKVRLGSQRLDTGTQTLGSEVTAGAVAFSDTDVLTIGRDTADALGTIAYYAIATGSGVATGMSSNLSTILSSFATYMKSQTGTQQAKFLWFPDSPLNCDQHPSMAPEETDVRHSESPTGFALGLSGNRKYVHENVRWDRVPVDRIREASATYDNASLEVFFRDAISGLGGHAWGGPCRDLQIYWSNAGTDTLLGADANSSAGTDGWRLVGASKFKDIAVPSQPGWVGAWNVRFGRLVSDG